MNQILHCDWLPKRQDGAVLPTQDTGFVPQGKFGVLSHIRYNPLLTKLVWSRWLDIGLNLFFACWTLTSYQSINMQKKNLANIQPS